ncbi:MAG: potassium channel family protein [archaeon]|nr:potassium channel family protein [archaeon]
MNGSDRDFGSNPQGLVERRRRSHHGDGEEVEFEFDPYETAYIFTLEEAQDIVQTFDRMKNDLMFLKAKFQTDVVIRRPKRDPLLKAWLTDNLLLISFIWQTLNVIVLHLIGVIDPNGGTSRDLDVDIGLGIMILFQLVHLLLTVVVSTKLVKQVSHRTVSGWFLVQSYLSAILLFAGIYSLLFRANTSSFNGVIKGDVLDAKQSDLDLIRVFISFVYFSTATMATVGYGDITAALWWTKLVVLCQMLLTVLYNTVILSIGLSHFSGQTIIHQE